MAKKKTVKTNKNLFLPPWVIELLDSEGERYGGPGEIAAIAIFNFCSLNDLAKKEAIKKYRDEEADRVYSIIQNAAEAHAASPEQKKQKHA